MICCRRSRIGYLQCYRSGASTIVCSCAVCKADRYRRLHGERVRLGRQRRAAAHLAGSGGCSQTLDQQQHRESPAQQAGGGGGGPQRRPRTRVRAVDSHQVSRGCERRGSTWSGARWRREAYASNSCPAESGRTYLTSRLLPVAVARGNSTAGRSAGRAQKDAAPTREIYAGDEHRQFEDSRADSHRGGFLIHACVLGPFYGSPRTAKGFPRRYFHARRRGIRAAFRRDPGLCALRSVISEVFLDVCMEVINTDNDNCRSDGSQESDCTCDWIVCDVPTLTPCPVEHLTDPCTPE